MNCQHRAPFFSTFPSGNFCKLPDTSCRRDIAEDWNAFDTRQEFSKSITRSVHQFHGKLKRAVARAQFILAAVLTKLRRRNVKLRGERFPSGHSCWLPNRVCSMQRVRHAVSTRSGPIATFHLTAMSTCRTKLNRRSSGSLPAFAIASSPAI